MPSYAAATSVPEHHPSIAAIEPTPQLVSEGFLLEFPDILTRTEFVLGMPGFRVQDTSQPITPLHPTFDEEYVEWVDVFEASTVATTALLKTGSISSGQPWTPGRASWHSPWDARIPGTDKAYGFTAPHPFRTHRPGAS
jgi:hypothetical protein